MKLNVSFEPAPALALSWLLLASPSPAATAEKLNVVTTTEDLGAIAREVGGNLVDVTPLCRGYQDPHFVDPRPSYLVKLNRADLFVQVGLELEVGWAPALLNSARNPKILPGAPGFVDASRNIQALEVPAVVSRSLGDVHPMGNPHVWLDPSNGIVMARTICDALSNLRPADAAAFQERRRDFEVRVSSAFDRWRSRASEIGLSGIKVVTYHRSWSYFARAFGIEVVDFVEPQPGVPPSPSHIRSLIERIKSTEVKLLIVETYFDPKLPQRIAKDAGVPLVILPSSVGAEKGISTTFDLFDRQLLAIETALKETRS